jgi:leucyl-tRNA synthetase
LDINLGGKEHQTVHFPVFMMNHAAIMPGLMPRGIFVNWWVQGKSGKMSKSKGGAEPIPNAARAYTVDGLRLYYCHVASPHVDIEWDEAAVNNSRKSVERAWHFTQELLEAGTGEPGPMDPWLGSRVHRHLVRAGLMMEENKLREAANVVYFDMVNDLRWYARRGGGNRQLLRKAVDAWVRTMAPFTPHMAEELWEAMGGEGLVSSAEYPAGEGFAPDSAAEAAEELVEGLLDDISGILKMTGMTPRRIMLYTAHPWKYEVQRRMALDGWDMGAVMKHAQTVPEMRNHSKEMGAFASGMMKKIKQFGPAGVPVPTLDDEVATLRSAAGFLEREFGCDVLVLIGDEPGFADPKNKRAVASPGKPGIHVE